MLRRPGRADRRHPDPDGRRCARRRGAVDARGDRRPIKFAGTGEKLDALEQFHPDRVAGRILGMGDIVGLVERAAETFEAEEAEKLAAQMAKGQFDMDDLRMQLQQMKKMGGLGALAGMIPGMKPRRRRRWQGAVDDKVLVRMEAIIGSMTPKERTKPDLINAKRKIRIAKGSRHDGAGRQQAHEDAPGNGGRDEAACKKMGGMKGLAAMFGKGGGGGMAARHARRRPAAACRDGRPGLPRRDGGSRGASRPPSPVVLD